MSYGFDMGFAQANSLQEAMTNAGIHAIANDRKEYQESHQG